MELDINQMQRIETAMLREIVRIFQAHQIKFYFSYGSVLGAIRHYGPIPWDCDADLAIPVNELPNAIVALKSELPSVFRVDDLDSSPHFYCTFPRVGLAHSSSSSLHVDLFPIIGLPDNRQVQIRISKKFDRYRRIFVRKNFRQKIRRSSFVKRLIGLLIELAYFPCSRKRLWKRIYAEALEYPFEGAKFVMTIGGGYGVKRILEKKIWGTPVWYEYEGIKVPVPENWDCYLKHFYNDYLSYPPKEERDLSAKVKCEIDDQDYVNFEKYEKSVDSDSLR